MSKSVAWLLRRHPRRGVARRASVFQSGASLKLAAGGRRRAEAQRKKLFARRLPNASPWLEEEARASMKFMNHRLIGQRASDISSTTVKHLLVSQEASSKPFANRCRLHRH